PISASSPRRSRSSACRWRRCRSRSRASCRSGCRWWQHPGARTSCYALRGSSRNPGWRGRRLPVVLPKTSPWRLTLGRRSLLVARLLPSGLPMLNDDRLFPADPATRDVARRLFESIRSLPLISPHGHTEPRWYAENAAFPDPAQLIVVPDHYVTRMLVSQG